MITYDSRTGQFRNSDGRFVKRGVILQRLNEIQNNTQTQIEKISKQLVNRQISLSIWQERMIGIIKEGNIQTMAFGAGGRRKLTKAHYGKMGANLKSEWSRLNNFVDEIKKGNLTPEQIINRAKLYSQSVATQFYGGEMLTKGLDGFKYAKRWLDSGARHCSQCPSYSTNGLWRPLSEVILPGHRCDCRGRCRCGISYKK